MLYVNYRSIKLEEKKFPREKIRKEDPCGLGKRARGLKAGARGTERFCAF